MARLASPGDASIAARVLARAFAADPLLTTLLGNRNDVVSRLTRYFELEARLAAAGPGEVWLDDDGLGAAVWRRPGGWPDSTLTQLRSLPAYFAVFTRRFGAATKAVNTLARVHPREPHWYLPFVGVVPEAAGTGRGTALLVPVLERCDRDRTGAYLEATSADSARLFHRLGFAPCDQMTVADEVTVRPMWRSPAQSDATS